MAPLLPQPPGTSRPLIAWMSTKFPLELPAALGLTVYCPESAAAAAAGQGTSLSLCRAGENSGYCGDLCSYVRMGMAIAADPTRGHLPRPDVLLCCDNICSGMLQWYQAMARTLNVPLLLLNIPYHQTDSPSPEALAYFQAQFFAVLHALEDLTGRQCGPERLHQVCRQANRTVRAWQAVLDTALAHPSPLDNLELFQYMPWMVTGRCDPAVESRLWSLTRELRSRPADPSHRTDYRVFWEGSPCWPNTRGILPLLKQRHIQIVADTITPSLCFRYSSLEGLARAYCGTINGISLEEGVRMRAALCRRFQIDGVLVHYNRSCRPWCGTLQEVERRLRRELRLPIVAFEGDQGDPSVFSLSHFATRLDSLTELMDQSRGSSGHPSSPYLF